MKPDTHRLVEPGLTSSETNASSFSTLDTLTAALDSCEQRSLWKEIGLIGLVILVLTLALAGAT